MAGSLAFTESTLTISSGSVTATRSAHVIAAESGTTDDLANIATGSVSDFCIVHIRPDSGDTITVKDAATGNGEIHLSGNFDYVMSGDNSLIIQRRGADWYEIARDSASVLEFVSTAAITAATTVVVTGLAAGYDYIFQLEAFAITDDLQTLWMRFSDDGGVSYEADGTDYSWALLAQASHTIDASDNQIDLSIASGNDANNMSSLSITLVNPNSTGEPTTAYWAGFVTNGDATPVQIVTSGGAVFIQGTDAVDAVQFLWSGGSTFKAQGDITVWRRRRS